MLLQGRRGNLAQRDDGHRVHHRQAQRGQAPAQAQHQQHGQGQLARGAHGRRQRRRQQGHMVFIGEQGHRGLPVAGLGQPRKEKDLGDVEAGRQRRQRLQAI